MKGSRHFECHEKAKIPPPPFMQNTFKIFGNDCFDNNSRLVISVRVWLLVFRFLGAARASNIKKLANFTYIQLTIWQPLYD
jgi:hypothetical protein